MQLSLIVPCYNEQDNVEAFHDACRAAFDGRIASYELIFVNDGSRDDTWARLTALQEKTDVPVKLIDLSRNFGKEAAMYAGMQRAEGEFVTVIDADLQQPPEKALEMVQFLEANPDFDAVAAYQDARREGRFTALCKKLFYHVIDAACDIPFKADASDFRTLRRGVVQAILSMGEYHRFSKGIVSWVGFRTHYLPYTVQPRHAGKTSWSFVKLCRYAVEGIIVLDLPAADRHGHGRADGVHVADLYPDRRHQKARLRHRRAGLRHDRGADPVHRRAANDHAGHHRPIHRPDLYPVEAAPDLYRARIPPRKTGEITSTAPLQVQRSRSFSPAPFETGQIFSV